MVGVFPCPLTTPLGLSQSFSYNLRFLLFCRRLQPELSTLHCPCLPTMMGQVLHSLQSDSIPLSSLLAGTIGLSLASAPLLKEFLCGPLTTSGGLFSESSLSAKGTKSVLVREPARTSDSFTWSFSLDLSQMALGRVLQWYYITQGTGEVLLRLPAVILSLGQACSRHTISTASTSLAISLCLWSSQLLSPTTASSARFCPAGGSHGAQSHGGDSLFPSQVLQSLDLGSWWQQRAHPCRGGGHRQV